MLCLLAQSCKGGRVQGLEVLEVVEPPAYLAWGISEQKVLESCPGMASGSAFQTLVHIVCRIWQKCRL